MSVRLRATKLSGGRGTTTAFRSLDLEVQSGHILALLGPNGAGKTSLLLTLAGLLRPSSGTIEVDGTPLAGGRPAVANATGIVLLPDNRSLFPSLTVEENLKVAARRNGPSPSDMLHMFPALQRRWTVRAGAISGGEQQMLAMARALIQEPKVLLADELSMGLAPLIVEQLFTTIRRIADDVGCAVVLVEQHVGLALKVADETVVLNHGSFILREDAARLREHPNVLVEAYLGAGAETSDDVTDDPTRSAPAATALARPSRVTTT